MTDTPQQPEKRGDDAPGADRSADKSVPPKKSRRKLARGERAILDAVTLLRNMCHAIGYEPSEEILTDPFKDAIRDFHHTFARQVVAGELDIVLEQRPKDQGGGGSDDDDDDDDDDGDD